MSFYAFNFSDVNSSSSPRNRYREHKTPYDVFFSRFFVFVFRFNYVNHFNDSFQSVHLVEKM